MTTAYSILVTSQRFNETDARFLHARTEQSARRQFSEWLRLKAHELHQTDAVELRSYDRQTKVETVIADRHNGRILKTESLQSVKNRATRDEKARVAREYPTAPRSIICVHQNVTYIRPAWSDRGDWGWGEWRKF